MITALGNTFTSQQTFSCVKYWTNKINYYWLSDEHVNVQYENVYGWTSRKYSSSKTTLNIYIFLFKTIIWYVIIIYSYS